MTAAHEQTYDAKQIARFRSIAEQVTSPVASGKHAKGRLKANQRWQWNRIVDRTSEYYFAIATSPEDLAKTWKRNCQAVGIGAGLFGWLVWNWAFPLLLELAKRWIEAQQTQQD